MLYGFYLNSVHEFHVSDICCCQNCTVLQESFFKTFFAEVVEALIPLKILERILTEIEKPDSPKNDLIRLLSKRQVSTFGFNASQSVYDTHWDM